MGVQWETRKCRAAVTQDLKSKKMLSKNAHTRTSHIMNIQSTEGRFDGSMPSAMSLSISSSKKPRLTRGMAWLSCEISLARKRGFADCLEPDEDVLATWQKANASSE